MDPIRSPETRVPLAPDAQTACYSPWLKVRVLIRAALTTPWSGREWAEVRQHLPLAPGRRVAAAASGMAELSEKPQ